MKKILIAVISMLVCMTASAQYIGKTADVVPGMKYREYKNLYDTHFYERQGVHPYSPVGSGIASLFIPGLGEIINGQAGRGILIIGTNVASTLCLAAIANYAAYEEYDPVTDTKTIKVNLEGGDAAAVLGILAGKIILNIWSIFDAAHIAKVKDMYFQDIARQYGDLSFDVEPFLTMVPSGNNIAGSTLTPTAGLSMKLSF